MGPLHFGATTNCWVPCYSAPGIHERMLRVPAPSPRLTQTPFAMVPRWVLRHPNLKPSSKIVYAGIADHANRDSKQAWPGQRLLAEELCLSKTTVNEAIGELEAVGALQIERRNGRVNRYHVPLDPPTVAEPTLLTVPEPGTGVPETGTPTVPETGTEQEPVEQEPKKKIEPNGSKPLTEHQAMKQAIIKAIGWNPREITNWGPIDKASKQLRDIGVHPDEVAARARVFREKRAWQTLTPSTLVAAWPDLLPAGARPCPNGCGPDGFYFRTTNDPYPVACDNPGCETKRKALR